jgi:hypothetical protein
VTQRLTQTGCPPCSGTSYALPISKAGYGHVLAYEAINNTHTYVPIGGVTAEDVPIDVESSVAKRSEPFEGVVHYYPSELPCNTRKAERKGGRGERRECRKMGLREEESRTCKQSTWLWSHVVFHMVCDMQLDRSSNCHIANDSKSGKPYPTRTRPHRSLYSCLSKYNLCHFPRHLPHPLLP